MIIRNRIWEELYMSKVYMLHLLTYTARHRRYNRYYEAFIAITASLGAFGFLQYKLAPLISTIIIGVISVAKSIFPSFIQREEELSSLDSITNFYAKYMTQLEQLFYQYEHHLFDKDNQKNDDKAAESFFIIKKNECEIQTRMNKYLRRTKRRENENLNQNASEYVNRVYFNKYESKENENKK